MIAVISVEDWFGYVFVTIFAIGIAVLAVLFIGAMLGFFDKKD